MIAVHGVRTEPYVIDTHEILDVLEVLHHRLERVGRVVTSDRGVGSGFHPAVRTVLNPGEAGERETA